MIGGFYANYLKTDTVTGTVSFRTATSQMFLDGKGISPGLFGKEPRRILSHYTSGNAASKRAILNII